MSKLNTKGTRPAPKKTYKAPAIKNVSLEMSQGVSANGNRQWNKEPLQHLYELTVSTLLGRDTFYRSSDQLVKNMEQKVREAVTLNALDFVANLAVHARVQMNIRSFPVMVVVQFAKAVRDQGKSYENMRRLVGDVIQRADQITDMYAYALEVFGSKNKIPMAIKRGVGDAFNKFGEYNFAKYNRDGSVKFRDVLRIVHPVAKDEKQGFIFEKIMKETLDTPYTWETELSKNGQLQPAERKTDKQLWTEIVQSGKLGYMALRMNVRNIVKAGVDDTVIRESVANVLADPARVAHSKQFPFSFIQARNAVKEVGGNRTIERALDQALEAAVANIPVLGVRPVIIIDKSGSMTQGRSTIPTFTPYQQASMLASMVIKAHRGVDNLAVIAFGSDAVIVDVNPDDSVSSIGQAIDRSRAGGSTNFGSALNLVSKLSFQPDVVFVFTDGEINALWNSRHNLPSTAIKIAVNFEAADSTPMPQREGWYPFSGFSEKMFIWLPLIREQQSIIEMLSQSYCGVEVFKQRTAEQMED